jgi:3D (Asp-Asp-Asp) domain-containing protein
MTWPATRHGVCRGQPGVKLIVLVIALILAVAATQACAGRVRPAASPRATSRAATRPAGYEVTAYCKGRITSAGTRVREGIVAADSSLLPIGTVIRIAGLPRGYDGTFRVLDTGAAIRGRRLDLYIADCREAVRFGRRSATVTIVRPAQ